MPGADSFRIWFTANRLAALGAVAVFAFVGIWSVTAPEAVDADAPLVEFSAERAMEHVSAIAVEPRPMGSPANATARQYIVDELAELGVAAELQSIKAPDIYGSGGTVPVVNVIGRLPGTATTGSIVMMAHYDTFPNTPGANDNAAAVAALLESARALQAGDPTTNDVVLLFTDGEEPFPRFGSPGFLKDATLSADVAFVVNLESAGGSGPSQLAEVSGPEAWVVAELMEASPDPAAFSVVTATIGLMGDLGTDFDPFRNAGIAGVHFAYMRGSPIYHTPQDSIERVSLDSLQHHGSHTLGIARHFGALDLSDLPDTGGAVYFKVGPLAISYPAVWALPLALLTLVTFGWAVAVRFRRAEANANRIALAAGGLFLRLLLATIVGTLAWLLLVGARPTMSVLESYGYLAAIVAVGAVIVAKSRRRKGFDESAGATAVVLLWVVLALLTATLMPGASYLFLWPALVSSAVLLWWHGVGQSRDSVRLAFVAAPALALTVPIVDVFFLLSQPRPGNLDSQIPATFAVPILLALLVISLLASFWPRPAAPDYPAPLPAQSVLKESLVSSSSL